MKYSRLTYLTFVLVLLTLASCEEETTDDVSFITTYPEFTLEGGDIIFATVADGYSEPGVTAKEGEKTLELTITGEVDPATPGYYAVTYSATNSDGFTGSATREVIITSEDISETDLSGSYVRGTTANTVTQVVPGYYHASNGSGDGNNVVMNFVHIGGDDLVIPLQPSQYGNISGTGTITDTGYSVSIYFHSHDLTLERTFVKQ